MGKALEFETQKAVYTSAFYSGTSYDDTSFGLVIVPAPGRSLPEAETDLDAVLARFMEEGPDMEAFARIKTQIKASQIFARDNLQSRARRYGEALTAGVTVEDVQAWPEILQAVTPEDVMAAAERLFDKRRSVTGYATPTAPQESANDDPHLRRRLLCGLSSALPLHAEVDIQEVTTPGGITAGLWKSLDPRRTRNSL